LVFFPEEFWYKDIPAFISVLIISVLVITVFIVFSIPCHINIYWSPLQKRSVISVNVEIQRRAR